MAINSLNASSYGLSGMVSGMNTQEMVEKMLSGTKNKIMVQQQKKAQLEYKQEMYRGLATQLRGLQNSFFSYSSPTTNLMSSGFYNSMMAKTDSKYFTATATSNAESGSSKVDYIKQLAKAASLTGKSGTSAKLKSDYPQSGTSPSERIPDLLKAYQEDKDNLATISFTIDGENGAKEVASITSTQLQSLAGKSNDEAATLLNKYLADSKSGITAEYSNGQISFKTSGKNENLIINTNEKGRELFGFTGASVSGAGGISAKLDTRKLLPSFQVQMDNQEKKTVYFDPQKYMDMKKADGTALYTGMDSLKLSLEEGLQKVYGDAISVTQDGEFGVTFDVKDKSRSFTFTGADKAMDIMGIKSGQSNKMTTGMRLDQITFAKKLDGNEFKFSINDVDFNVSADTTLSSLMTQINNSAAGVKLTYNQNTDKFTMTSSVSGTGSDIKITQKQGNLMTALFGVEGNTDVSGKFLVTNTKVTEKLTGSSGALDSQAGEVKFNMVTADGTNKMVTMNVGAFTDKQKLIDELNKQLDADADTKKAGVKFTLANDKISIEANAGTELTLDAPSGSTMEKIGFTDGQKNYSMKAQITGEDVPLRSKGGKMEFDMVTADGTKRTITINVAPPEHQGEVFTNKQAYIDALNVELDKNEDAKKAGVKFTLSDGKISLEANAGTKLSAKAGAGSAMAQMGFTNGQTNGATLDAKLTDALGGSDLADFKMNINGVNITKADLEAMAGSGNDITIDTLQKTIQKTLLDNGSNMKAEWDASQSKFRFTGGTVGEKITFSGSASNLSNGDVKFTAQNESGLARVEGENSRLSINGNEIERSDNNFTYEGVTYTLTQTFDKRQKDADGNLKLQGVNGDKGWVVDSQGSYIDKFKHFVIEDSSGTRSYADKNGNLFDIDGNAITGGTAPADWEKNKLKADAAEQYMYDERAGQVDVSRNTDQIYDGIVKFVDEYNKIMKTLHTLVTEDPDYKDYPPLSDEEKAALSDREVELWEEKSKTGLLRGDSTLNKIWNDMRSTIYKKPAGSDIAIYNIGITTSAATDFGGQLVVNYSKLRESVTANPEGIRDMFIDSMDGVATVVNNSINRAAKISSASPGSLVSLAGSTKSDTSSALYRQMKEINNNVSNLKDKYDMEYNRYWKQFNNMEQMVNQMNQQSSWLAQQFA